MTKKNQPTIRHQYYAVDEHYFDNVIVPRERVRYERGSGRVQREPDSSTAPDPLISAPHAGGNWWDPEPLGEIYSRIGNDAHIDITGELDPEYYAAIVAAMSKADKDQMINRIILDINSPGGTVEGVAQASDAIKSARKPVEAHVSYMAASGAYWLASQAGKIMAEVGTVMVGSIGVIVATWDFTRMYKDFGVDRIIIVSTKSPKKYSDPATAEGKKEIVKGLDDIYAEFAGAIAKGRGVTVEKVESDYGQGAVLIAAKALQIGMIDGIQTAQRGKQMDNETKIFSQVEMDKALEGIKAAGAQATADAVKTMRADTVKHLNYIGKVQDDKIIMANIAEGKSFADCVEAYAESAGTKKAADERIAAAHPESLAPKGQEAKTAEEKAKTQATLDALKNRGYKAETTNNGK